MIYILLYTIIGLITSIVEWYINSGEKLKLFDIINFLFWLPLLFFDKGKIYKWMHPNGD